jgi:hypothetical protein
MLSRRLRWQSIQPGSPPPEAGDLGRNLPGFMACHKVIRCPTFWIFLIVDGRYLDAARVLHYEAGVVVFDRPGRRVRHFPMVGDLTLSEKALCRQWRPM